MTLFKLIIQLGYHSDRELGQVMAAEKGNSSLKMHSPKFCRLTKTMQSTEMDVLVFLAILSYYDPFFTLDFSTAFH